jgi:hypothetical protein
MFTEQTSERGKIGSEPPGWRRENTATGAEGGMTQAPPTPQRVGAMRVFSALA